MRLKRLSDIQHDEITGNYLEEFPTQRDLFSDQRSGTFQEGYVGVWDWHVIPNKKDPSRDFIHKKNHKLSLWRNRAVALIR